MPDRRLLDRIQGADGELASPAAAVETRRRKYVVVDLSGAAYAIPAEQVREIVIDFSIHYLPFVPPYIRGLVNRHGEAYTAVDLCALLRKEAISGEKTLLVLNLEDDRLALLASSVREIVKVEESAVFPIVETDESQGFLSGSLRLGGEDIFVVSIEGLRRKMDKDLGTD